MNDAARARKARKRFARRMIERWHEEGTYLARLWDALRPGSQPDRPSLYKHQEKEDNDGNPDAR